MGRSNSNHSGNDTQKILYGVAAIIFMIVFVVRMLLSMGDVKDNSQEASSKEALYSVENDLSNEEKDILQEEEGSEDEEVLREASKSSEEGSGDEQVLKEASQSPEEASVVEPVVSNYKFRNNRLLNDHYEKHGVEMGFNSPEEYEKAAAAVTVAPGVLHKTEAEDGDDVYYLESTNEFVIVSTDGYIRTYFLPSGGIDYYNRQ